MQAIFYQFAKRTNSTKRPSGGHEFGIDLKAPCNIIDPEIKIATQKDPTGYNYCYLPTFSRYYWVKNWTYADGLWVASLTVDTLASYRDQIGNSTEYVVRSSVKYDPKIADNLYPTKATITEKTISANTTIFSDLIANYGFFVVSAVAPGYVSFGGSVRYAMTAQTFRKLMGALLSNTDYLNISADEISSNLTKALFNPIQYITGAFWVPLVNPPDWTLKTSEVNIGWWTFTNIGEVAILEQGNDSFTTTISVSIPKHPAEISRGIYCDGAPYSEYKLFVPGFGTIAVNADRLMLKSTLYLRFIIDFYTGDTILQLATQPDFINIFYATSGNIAVQAQIAQITQNVQRVASIDGLIQAGVGAIAGAASAFFSGGDVVNGITSGAQQISAESQSKGGVSSVAQYGITPYLTAKFYDLVEDNNEHHGRPLCQKVQLFSIPGFMMVDDPDIALPATAAEIDSVKSYMKNGFFLE